MAKVTISGFVYHYQAKWDNEPTFRFAQWDSWGDNDPDYALIGPASFEYELPDNFSPVPAKLAALEKVKQQVRAEFSKRVKELDDQINSLLALEMS